MPGDKWAQYAEQQSAQQPQDKWAQYADAQATQPTQVPPQPIGTIGAAPTGVLPWLRNVESDVRTGTASTGIGKFLRMLGAPGTDTGTTPETANQIAGPLLGPVTAAQGVAEKSPLKAVGGVLQAAAPALAFQAPEASKALEAAPGAARAAGEAVANGANNVDNALARILRAPATAAQSLKGEPGKVKTFLPASLQKWMIPDALIPKGELGTVTNPGPFAQIPARVPRQVIKETAQTVADEAGNAASQMPRPLRPTVGTPEEWAQYEQQMGRLKQEASDAGTYSAARGRVGKKLNYQQRIGKNF